MINLYLDCSCYLNSQNFVRIADERTNFNALSTLICTATRHSKEDLIVKTGEKIEFTSEESTTDDGDYDQIMTVNLLKFEVLTCKFFFLSQRNADIINQH
jgi:hypothetical protein